jgi:lysophospholipase L1-like esterase
MGLCRSSIVFASVLGALGSGCAQPAPSDDDPPANGQPSAGQGGASGPAGATAPPTPSAGTGSTAGSGDQTPVGTGGAGGAPGPMAGAGAGTGGAGSGGAGGGGAGGAAGSTTTPEHVPPCIDDPADVVLIGDSYIDWITHTFVADIRAESGQQWPSYAIGGTSMATGGIGHIPDQLDTALADNPEIKAIVMTGGGNDILVADTIMFPDAGMCTSVQTAPMIPDCMAIVAAALEEAKNLMDKTADKGIRDVVYFFYPHIPGGGLISGPYPNPMLDYSMPLARDVCDSAFERTQGRMRCTFIDMIPVFEGKTGLFADAVSEAGDGVHPNSMGSKVLAAEVWRVMKEQCIGQPASAGCCMPQP